MLAKFLSAMSLNDQSKMVYHIATWPASYDVFFPVVNILNTLLQVVIFLCATFCLNNTLSRHILIDFRLSLVLLWFAIFLCLSI